MKKGQPQIGRTIDDVGASSTQEDHIRRVREALENLGSDHWMYVTELAKLVGLGTPQLKQIEGMFPGLIVRPTSHHRKIWAGSVELADKIKQRLTQ